MPLLVRHADVKFHECDQCKELFPTPALLQVHVKCQHSGRCPRGAPGQGGPGCAPPRRLTAAQPRPSDSRVVLIHNTGPTVLPTSQGNCELNTLVQAPRREASQHHL